MTHMAENARFSNNRTLQLRDSGQRLDIVNRAMPMYQQQSPRTSLRSLRPGLLVLACGLLACVGPEDGPSDDLSPRAAQDDSDVETAPGESKPVGSLPSMGADETVETFMQLLPEPTVHGENVAVHMKLPAPSNPELTESLVRVFGNEQNPVMAFNTNALLELGVVPDSPGPDFFTAFVQLDMVELEQRLQIEQQLAGREDVTEQVIRFRGRTPFAITTGVPLDLDVFNGGGPVALGPCPVMPASVLARWEESLLITDPDVVQDPTRTNDACAGGGNPDGVWTFKHLMEEMAIGSGMSTHDFVVDWLENWLNDATINGDDVPQRTQMFNQVIQPWANQSGVSANLVFSGGTNTLVLSGNLDLDIAPFRLSAIVNRIDLGRTASGGGGYGGGSSSQPVDAGELRFIFGVQNLDTCQQLTFSVIHEYGVPIEGCADVRDWALQWIELNDGANLPRFSNAWRAHLEGLTESVVLHGAAPGRGNDNAINQIRTNEIALSGPWELREFTLTNEDLMSIDTTAINPADTPVSGALQPHTVAMTPDDDSPSFTPFSSFEINDFVANFVVPSGSGVPGDCSASYVVPADHPSTGVDFRGGNSFTSPPNHWEAAVSTSAIDKCKRHQFSLNTCNGCHRGDTSTSFFHVDPTAMPASLSNFLTGGALGVWSVPDSQFGTPSWDFADLDRRFHRLYEIACTSCGFSFALAPSAFELVAEFAGVVPIDVGPGVEAPFPTGPIHDLDVLVQLLDLRAELVNADAAPVSVEMNGFIHEVDNSVH
ncbi:MAG: hypothetical protein AB1Z98_02575 [Nannocystaceae bacterium]